MSTEERGDATASRRAGTPRRDVNRHWYWLLVIPFVGVLVPPIYNGEDPRLIGIPFFYWYQMAWIPISVLLTVVVYRRTRG